MIYNYELKSSLKKLDVKLFIHEVGKYRFNWHEKIEIILVLKGAVQVFSDGQVYNLVENDVILVNPNSPHSTLAWGKGNIVLTLQFNPSYCNEFLPHFDMLKIKCICLQSTPNNEHYNILRNLLANIALAFFSRKKGHLFEIEAYLNTIISFILEQCEYTHWDTKELQQEQKDLYKIKNIVNYIDENYDKVITLDEIAQKEYLNKYYLSHYFKKHMGINFSDYIAKVRFKNAIYELNSTSKTISDIALNNGFPNVKSFNAYFKNNFKKTPSEYRRLFKDTLVDLRIKDNIYVSTSNGVVLQKLKEYGQSHTTPIGQYATSPRIVDISMTTPKTRFNKNWGNTINLTDAKCLLSKDLSSNLYEIKSDLNLEYLKLSFDEKFYNIDEYSIIIAEIIDTLLKAEINPFFRITTNSAKINDFIHWSINKYGNHKVSHWRLSFSIKNYNNLSEFYNILDTIKHLDVEYGFSFNGNFDKATISFLEDLVSCCINNNINPSFFEFNTYDYVSYDHALEFYQKLKLLSHTISPNCQMILSYNYLCSIANKPDSITSLHKIMEFISTGLTTYDEISSFDLLDESSNFSNCLATTWFKNLPGLMSSNIIKKPAYYLFTLINELGNELILQDKNYIITSTRKNIQVLLYNFYLDHITGVEGSIPFDISINDIWGKYKLTSYILNRSHGAILRKYSDMGSPKYLTQEELNYLKSTCRPKIITKQFDINGTWNFSLEIQPWEVVLVRFDFISPLGK